MPTWAPPRMTPQSETASGSTGAWPAIDWKLPLAATLLLTALCAVFPEGYLNLLIRLAAVNIVVVCALNLLMGYGGQAFLAVAATFAIGAYGSSLGMMKLGLPWLIAIVFGGSLAAVFGLLTSLPALRLSGAYLAMVSIAFNVIVEEVLVHWQGLTGGPVGLTGIPRGGPFGLTLSDQWMATAICVAAILAWWVVDRVRFSPWGQTIMAVRESEIAARSLGVDSTRVKAVTFSVSAFMMGVGGALYAHSAQYISPDVGGIFGSILFVLMLVLGGAGSRWGPAIGALILTFLPQFLTEFQKYHVFVLGVILLVCITLRPRGIASLFTARATRGSRGDTGKPQGVSPSRLLTDKPQGASAANMAMLLDIDKPVEGAPLQVQGISCHFGGIVALSNVSLTVNPGTVHGLIGPNGAGKSTLVNVITGHYRASSGAVLYRHHAIHTLSMPSIARLGIVRTFQKPMVFSELSVLENLEVAQFSSLRHSLIGGVLGLPSSEARRQMARQRAIAIADAVGLGDRVEQSAGTLAQGQQRLLEIGRALAARPGILVLDEPAAGLSAAEINELVGVLRQLRAAGIAVLLIEHHMNMVMSVCDQITVIDRGEHLATGTPTEIRASEAVRRAYLGATTHAFE